MPFKSKAQVRKCYEMKNPKWDCDRWSRETFNKGSLPERKKIKTKMRTR